MVRTRKPSQKAIEAADAAAEVRVTRSTRRTAPKKLDSPTVTATTSPNSNRDEVHEEQYDDSQSPYSDKSIMESSSDSDEDFEYESRSRKMKKMNKESYSREEWAQKYHELKVKLLKTDTQLSLET